MKIWQCKLVYSTLFVAYGALYPFTSVFFNQAKQFSKTQIGVLNAIPPVVSAVANVFWGYIADRFRARYTIMLGLVLLSSVLPIGMIVFDSFRMMVAAQVVIAFFQTAIGSLLDTTVLEILGDNKDLYGQVRLPGAIAWGVGAVAVGELIDYFNVNMIVYLYMGGLMVVFLMLWIGRCSGGIASYSSQTKTEAATSCASSSTSIDGINGAHPKSEADIEVQTENPAAQTQIQPLKVKEHIFNIFKILPKLLCNSVSSFFFYVTAFVLGIGLAIVASFLFLYLQDNLGASSTLLGLSIVFSILLELPVFHYSKALLNRLGVRGMVIVANVALIIRVFLYTRLENPWLDLPIELLHGLTYAMIFPAGVCYVSAIAPAGLETTAQGVFNGVFTGLGFAIGSVGGGFVYQQYGPKTLFLATDALVGGALTLFVLTFRWSRERAESAEVIYSQLADGSESRLGNQLFQNSVNSDTLDSRRHVSNSETTHLLAGETH